MEKNISLKSDKIFDIGIVLFTIFPFLFLMYIYLISKGEIIKVISETPKLTISFIGAMIMPFVGMSLKKIKEYVLNNYLDIAFLNLILLLISQILFFNMIGIILSGIIIFKIYRLGNLNLKNIKKCIKKEHLNFIFNEIIVFIALICFALNFRL